MTRFKIKSNGDPYHEVVSAAYFWVHVFDTKQEMCRWFTNYCQKREADGGQTFNNELNFSAINIPYERWLVVNGEFDRMHDNIGIILFHKKQLGAGIVAHEMGHAAMWYERLVNKNENAEFGATNNDTEERYLYLLHDFVKAFYQKAYKLKLL